MRRSSITVHSLFNSPWRSSSRRCVAAGCGDADVDGEGCGCGAADALFFLFFGLDFRFDNGLAAAAGTSSSLSSALAFGAAFRGRLGMAPDAGGASGGGCRGGGAIPAYRDANSSRCWRDNEIPRLLARSTMALSTA